MPKRKIAIIGYTGLIGSTFLRNFSKKKKLKIYKYNSANISNIRGILFDEVYCAGLPAQKWKANKFPKKDTKNTLYLIKNLKKIRCKKFFLISTIDIHKKREIYGINRLLLENFIKNKFYNYLIIRLPGVFGKGLKKNIIFDLLNNNNIEKISSIDEFQWYDLSLLYKDISEYEKKFGLNTICEFYSSPIKNSDIINLFPNLNIKKIKRKKIIYNYKPKNGFYKSKKFILKRIKKFIKEYES